MAEQLVTTTEDAMNVPRDVDIYNDENVQNQPSTKQLSVTTDRNTNNGTHSDNSVHTDGMAELKMITTENTEKVNIDEMAVQKITTTEDVMDLPRDVDIKAEENAQNPCSTELSVASDQDTNQETHTDNMGFACTLCDKFFARSGNLKRHMKFHTAGKLYNCEICEAEFSQAKSLKTHMESHTGEKPFACLVCENTFYTLSSIAEHMKVICEKTSYEAKNVRKHMKVRAIGKPFDCEAPFSDTDDNDDSLNNSVEPSASSVCEKPAMQVHTGEKPFACTVCD